MQTLRIVLLIIAAASLPAQQGAEKAAQQAAESWLALVDAGKYRESWSQTAPLFQQKVTRPQWEKSLQSVRPPLGPVVSRKLKTAAYTTSLPGVPDGEYVVIQYETSFEKKKATVETITPAKGAGGRWKVSGYFIR